MTAFYRMSTPERKIPITEILAYNRVYWLGDNEMAIEVITTLDQAYHSALIDREKGKPNASRRNRHRA